MLPSYCSYIVSLGPVNTFRVSCFKAVITYRFRYSSLWKTRVVQYGWQGVVIPPAWWTNKGTVEQLLLPRTSCSKRRYLPSEARRLPHGDINFCSRLIVSRHNLRCNQNASIKTWIRVLLGKTKRPLIYFSLYFILTICESNRFLFFL